MVNGCFTAEAVQNAIKEAEYEQNTTTFKSSTIEMQLVKKIEQLKSSVPKAKRLSEITPRVKEISEKRKEIWGHVKELKKQGDELKTVIEEHRQKMEEIREEQTDVKDQVEKINEVINAKNAEINVCFEEKQKEHDAHWKACYEAKVQQQLIRHIEWLQRQKDRILNREQEKLAAVEERENMIKNLSNPCEKQIASADDLVNFCQKLKIKSGMVQDSEVVAKEAQHNFLSEASRQNF